MFESNNLPTTRRPNYPAIKSRAHRSGGLPRCAQIATGLHCTAQLAPNITSRILKRSCRRKGRAPQEIREPGALSASFQRYADLRCGIRAQMRLFPRLQGSLTYQTIPGATKLTNGLFARRRRSRTPPLKAAKAAKPPRLPTGQLAPSTAPCPSSVLRIHFDVISAGSHIREDVEATWLPKRGNVEACCWSACTRGREQGRAMVASTTTSCCCSLRRFLMSPNILDRKHERLSHACQASGIDTVAWTPTDSFRGCVFLAAYLEHKLGVRSLLLIPKTEDTVISVKTVWGRGMRLPPNKSLKTVYFLDSSRVRWFSSLDPLRVIIHVILAVLA